MKFNTTYPADYNLVLRINSKYGKKGVEVPFKITIDEVIRDKFNKKPYFKVPPRGTNLIVNNDGKVQTSEIEIPAIIDDNNEPAYINFTHNGFGRLSYKFVG